MDVGEVGENGVTVWGDERMWVGARMPVAGEGRGEGEGEKKERRDRDERGRRPEG